MTDIFQEIELSIKILNKHKTLLSGIHLEVSPRMIAECEGEIETTEQSWPEEATLCDPRLNPLQLKTTLDRLIQLLGKPLLHKNVPQSINTLGFEHSFQNQTRGPPTESRPDSTEPSPRQIL